MGPLAVVAVPTLPALSKRRLLSQGSSTRPAPSMAPILTTATAGAATPARCASDRQPPRPGPWQASAAGTNGERDRMGPAWLFVAGSRAAGRLLGLGAAGRKLFLAQSRHLESIWSASKASGASRLLSRALPQLSFFPAPLHCQRTSYLATTHRLLTTWGSICGWVMASSRPPALAAAATAAGAAAAADCLIGEPGLPPARPLPGG